MSYTTNISFEKPDWKTLRYDLAINSNFDKVDAGLVCWASTTQPGQVGNYQDIEVTDGLLWMDLNYNDLKVYSEGDFKVILSTTGIEIADATWSDIITIDAEEDVSYTIPVYINKQVYYIPIFLNKGDSNDD
jgi:hypothetical protein